MSYGYGYDGMVFHQYDPPKNMGLIKQNGETLNN
jgi:hypothetical protein